MDHTQLSRKCWRQPKAASPIFFSGMYCRLYTWLMYSKCMAHIWTVYDLHMAHMAFRSAISSAIRSAFRSAISSPHMTHIWPIWAFLSLPFFVVCGTHIEYVLAIYGPKGASSQGEHPVLFFSSMRATQGRKAGGFAVRLRAHR